MSACNKNGAPSLGSPILHWPSSAARHSTIAGAIRVFFLCVFFFFTPAVLLSPAPPLLFIPLHRHLAERRRFLPLHSRALSFHARLPLPLSDHWLPWERVRPLSAVRRSDSTSSSPRRLGLSTPLPCRVFLPPLFYRLPSAAENQRLLSRHAYSQPSVWFLKLHIRAGFEARRMLDLLKTNFLHY